MNTKKLLSLAAGVLLAFSLAESVLAEEVKGTITKVGDEGREITVKTKGDKAVTVKISGSRTKIEGAKSRSDLAEGQNVVIDHEKGEATKVKVIK